MPLAAVRADIDQTADILLDFTADVSLRLNPFPLNRIGDIKNFFLG